MSSDLVFSPPPHRNTPNNYSSTSLENELKQLNDQMRLLTMEKQRCSAKIVNLQQQLAAASNNSNTNTGIIKNYSTLGGKRAVQGGNTNLFNPSNDNPAMNFSNLNSNNLNNNLDNEEDTLNETNNSINNNSTLNTSSITSSATSSSLPALSNNNIFPPGPSRLPLVFDFHLNFSELHSLIYMQSCWYDI
jgi:hypothetical protein